MKKIIIIIIAIVVIIAAYFLFFTNRQDPTNGPIDNGVEDSTTNGTENIEVKPSEEFLYPGAEPLMYDVEDSIGVSYYAVDAPLSEVASFYSEKFPSFEAEEDPVFGYGFYNSELFGRLFQMGEDEVAEWMEDNRGEIIGISVSSYDETIDEYQVFEPHKDKLTGKTLLVITHF